MNEQPLARLDSTITSVLLGVWDGGEHTRPAYIDVFVRKYSGPLVAHLVQIRRIDRADAEDLVQDFLLEKVLTPGDRNLAGRFIQLQEQSGGQRSFRRYLLKCLKHYLIDALRKKNRLPRQVSLDVGLAGGRTGEDDRGLDKFDMDWSNNLLSQAITLLHEAYGEDSAIWQTFEMRVLQPALTGCPPASYETIAESLHFDTPKQACNRVVTANRRFNAIIRQLVADYLPANPHQDQEALIEEEIGELRRVLLQQGGLRLALSFVTEPGQTTDSGSLRAVPLDLYSLDDTADKVWTADETAQIWRHFLRASLAKILREHGRDSLAEYEGVSEHEGHSLHTLGDLWKHPRPPVDILRSLKEDAKRAFATRDRGHDSEVGKALPAAINFLIYTTTIAAALLKCGVRITKDGDRKFLPNIELILGFDWIDPQTRDLMQQWQERILG